MSLDFGAWLGGGFVPTQAPLRAEIQQARILDKADTIALDRRGVTLPEQMVRIELSNTFSDASSAAGDSTMRRATIFGIQDHPTLPDTDIQLWDVFILENIEYTVVQVNRQMHGAIQAYAEGVG